MLKKRYSTIAVTIIMLIVALCVMGALYLIRSAYGFSKVYSIGLSIVLGAVMTFIALSLTRWREVVVTEQPMNYPPEDINPIQSGCIIDGRVDARDIIASFYYLAERGYMEMYEYELKRFKFKAKRYPDDESDEMKLLFRSIFGVEICDKINSINEGEINPDDIDEEIITVKLVDAQKRLIEAIPRVEGLALKKIRHKKNKEIADLTGKIRGFRRSLINNKGRVAADILKEDEDYIFTILPYAYEFAITAKIAGNFNIRKLKHPAWYHPYGVRDDKEFDVVIYNSMLRNMPEEITALVFDEINLLQRFNV